jgi:endonuclease YncB( thermonuclease family)
MTRQWSYPACTVIDVHDGDTVKIDIDHGMGIWSRGVLLRLIGIAARELKDPGGVEARDHLRLFLPVGSVVAVTSFGWDKFGGRIVGTIHLPSGESAQARMIADLYAVAWDGKGRQPVPAWPILS